jgi:lipopolysaccharide transport system permease protein
LRTDPQPTNLDGAKGSDAEAALAESGLTAIDRLGPAVGDFRIIEPQRGVRVGFADVLERRELLWMLTKRQIESRYRQMLLGIVWALLEPLGQLVMMTVVFGYLLHVASEGYPYPLFAFSGMTAWWLFSRATMAVAGSLLDNIGLISKVYFPRLILPLAATGRELFDNVLMLLVLLALSAAYGYIPTGKLLAFPMILLFAALFALACGLWLASLMVKFRDIRPMLSLALQAGMYATPIVYSANLVPERFRALYELNPMFWAVEFSRWALLGKTLEITSSLYWSLALVALLLAGGLAVFSVFERMTVDVQ